MAKSWEEIKKEREEKMRSSSNSQGNTRQMLNQGFLTSNSKPQQRSWEEIRKDRGYVEPEPEPTDYWKEQPIKTAFKNVNAGINMLPRGMVGVADATIGGLGIEPVNKVLDSYKDYYKKADEELAMRNQGHEFAGGVAQGIGQAIPTMALALMNPVAAAGSVVPTTAGGTQLVANAASLANPTTLNAARAVARSLKSNPTLYSSMVTSVGNQYLQGMNEGATREQAIKSAIIGGVPSALIEVSGGIENITNILANKTKGVAGAMLQSALEEGFEEIVQYPIENIGQKFAYDKNMPLFSMNEPAIINPKEMALSGLIGGTVGGLMGGGAAGVNSVLNKRYSKMVDTEYTKTIDSLPENSPILERVNQMQSDNVNIDDNMKIWVINSARNDGSSFESEVDKLLNKNGQANASIQNENIVPEQMVEQRQNVVKSQNNSSAEVNPTLSIFKIKNMRNAKEVKQNVYEFYKNTIISDSNNSKPIINKSSGMNIEISRATINQTFQADEKYSKNQDNEIKVAAMANVVDLIQNGEFTVVDNLDAPSSKTKYAEIKGTVNVNGTPYEITMDVRRTDNGKKLFVHSLSTNQQQVVNKKSGVIYNGVDDKVRQQYPKVYDILDRIGQVTGTKFKFVETIYDPSGQEAGFANGQYDPASDSIEIALDTFNPFMVVAKHEITHMLEKENPKLYNEYKNYVLEAMKQNGTYENEYGRMAALYESRGLKIDKLAIEDELVADATELFLTDENAINNLVAENKTLGQKILDVLRKLINKIEDILKVSGFTEGWLNTEQLREAEKLWVNALSSVMETDQRTDSKVDKKQSLKAIDDDWMPANDGDHIQKRFGQDIYTLWVGEGNQIPFGDFDTKQEGENFFNKHRNRLMKFRNSSNIESDLEDSIPSERKMLGSMLENARYIEREYAKYERSKSKMTSINDVISNIKGNEYRRADLESLAEQVSHGNWDDYDDMTDDELSSALIENIESQAKELNVLEKQDKRSGFSVRPPRNVKYSLKDSHGRELSKEQQDYLKNSKVRNDKGNLLVMYHGTPKGGFTEFRTGTYFTQNKEYADNYQSPNASSISVKQGEMTPQTYEVYLNIKKPFDTRQAMERKIFQDEFYRKYGTGTPLMESGLPDWMDGMDLQEFIEEQGYKYDGLILDEGGTGGYGDEVRSRGFSYVVFDSNQVKGVANKNPTKNDDIRYSLKNEVFYTSNKVEVIKNPTNEQILQLRAEFKKEYPELAKMGEPATRKTYDIDGNVYYWKSTDGMHYNIEHYIDKKFDTKTEQNKFFDIKYDDKKFSLKSPVEETKDLIALHNITEEKLKGTLELGGFPVPSIAITRAEQGHNNFGDISVVFTKDTIDPQSDRRNKVFGSDVYSKRFPYVNFKLDAKVIDRIRNKVNELTSEEYRKTYRISLDDTNIENVLQGYRSNGDFVKGYMDEPLLKLAFLKEKGIAFKPIMKEKSFSGWEPKLLEKIKKHLGDEEAAITFRNVKETEKIEPEIRQIVNEFYRVTVKDKNLLELITLKEPMGFGEIDRLLEQVRIYTREGSGKVIDYYKTKDKLEKVTPKKSYRDWLTNLSKGIIEKKGVRNERDLFTPSGNRRSFEQLNDEYTLDTIIKLMKGDVRGEEGFMYGLGNVRAGMTKEFKSVKDIKQDKDKIVSPEKFMEIKEQTNEEYYNLSSQFSKYHKSMYGGSDAFDSTMFETAKKGRIVPTALKANLKEDGYEVSDIPDFMIKKALDFLNSLKDMPTEYFEAKPQRGVGFDEVAAIVAPKTTNKELLQDLKNRAIKVVKYDEKIEGDRLQKVNSVKGVKFSLKDSKGKILTNEQAEYFKDSTVRDDKGNLQVVYHGTNADFTEFKTNKGELGTGIYFTNNNLEAGAYSLALHRSVSKMNKGNARIQNAYLNINNPYIIEKNEYENSADINIADTLKKDGIYDGIIATRWDDSIHYVAFSPEQIKSVDNKNPSSDPDIRYQLKDMTLKNNTAKYTHERLENILERYGSKSSPNYSQAYVAYISPDEFLSLTTTNLARIESESRELNLEDLQNETQEIFLKFDIDDKEVTGHEGRHRMVALREAGVKSVPVVLWQDGEKGKYNKLFLKSLKLTGEEFANNKAPGNVEIKNLVPASRAYEKTLTKDFVDAKGETTVRFQLRDNTPAKDIEKLQNTVTRLKEQFKLTKGVKLDEKAVRRLSKSILKEYGSTYSQTEFETKLYSVYMGMVNGDMEYDEAQSIVTESAREIVENASVLNDAMYKQYSDLRNTMRNTAISIEDMYKGDFDAVGGWNDFRKRNFGRMNITKDGSSVDSLYQELSDTYPEKFVKDIANPADQLMLISDVLDDLVPIYENPYNRDLNKSVEYLALEIFDGMTSIPEAKATFADKKKAEKQKAVEGEREKSKARIEALKNKNVEDVEWLKYQNKEKLTEVLNKEKAKRDNALAKVKEKYQGEAYKTWWRNKLKENDIKSHYQEMIKDLRANRDEKLENQKTKYKERISGIYEDRKIKQAKDRIRTMTKNLSKMLRNPTQKKHIPKALDKTVAELLAMLDFTTDRQNENTQLKLRDLRAEFEKIAKVSDEDGLSTTADPYITEALEMLHNKRIADMNLQEIELLRDIVGYFENMVKTYNKAFLGEKWVDISGRSTAIIQDLNTDNPMTESAYGRIVHFKNMMNWGMLNPQSFFERMGANFNSLYDDFRKALDVKIMNTKVAQDYMSNLLKGSTIKSWTGKKAEIKSIRLEGGDTIELTQAQLMSFYLLMKREQARGHIFGLGVKAAPIVAVNNKGIKYVKKQFEPVRITLNDAARMIAALTKEQRRIADGIGKFMNTYSKQWVNEATLQNYGYELAKEENYFPIKSDKDFLKSDFDNTNLDPTFTSMGFLKATVKGAGNAIILEDVFDVFTEHADKSATYNAFVGITESMKKIVNYKTENSSIKQSMNKKFGIQAFNYLKKFMVDLQGGLRTEGGSPLVNAMIRINKRTVLGLNVRTIVQQPTAIIRAAALIDPKYLIKGVAIKGDKAEMLEYSPIALWKSWGYFNLDTGRTMKDIILDTTPVLDKQYAGIQIADDITWTKIWNAVKLEIADTEPGLKGKEFFDAVNYRFSEIIDKTQVVDTVMHRSDAMRQSDSSWKYLTAFMSEPTKSYNLLLSAAEKFNNNKTLENKKELTRTISAWTATMIVNTLVISLVDVLRRKEDDDETFKDKWLGNVLNDVTGYVPLVRDIYSLFEGYSVKRMEYNGIERIVRAINRSKKYTEEMVEGKKHSYPARLITKDWIESLAYVFGVGAINVSKDLEALLRNYTRWIDDEGAVKEIYEFMFKK